ncbi:MAG: CRISPR-associated protein Cas4 [Halobacteriota archaeon]|uniref:CRISPR-associated protein Cas4 n=1 Tax=Natronomonas sp. TaxID=2184060 RepID=UPI003976795E
MQAFTDLATAAYCPRKLYYRRLHDDFEPSENVASIRNLAFRYRELLDPRADLDAEPIATTLTSYRSNLGRVKARLDRWDELVDPPETRALLRGKDANGIAHKLLSNPSAPVIVSPGSPPNEGVWESHSVWATAAAKALSWEQGEMVETAYVEYPAYGVVRHVRMTTRRKAIYRKALRVAESVDGPPPRLRDDSRCEGCAYRGECGTKTRSLRSRLSL